MPRGFSKGSNLTKQILLGLAITGCFIVAAGSPFFLTNFLRDYFKDKNRKTAWRRTARLRELAKKKVISIKELPDGNIKVELTQQGYITVRKYKLEELQLKKPNQWDKKWRVIIYDIPNHLKIARDAFRNKLKDLGLYQLQKSVWVSPYDCLPEMEFLCAVFNLDLNKYVFHFTTSDIPCEPKLKKHFTLRFSKI